MPGKPKLVKNSVEKRNRVLRIATALSPQFSNRELAIAARLPEAELESIIGEDSRKGRQQLKKRVFVELLQKPEKPLSGTVSRFLGVKPAQAASFAKEAGIRLARGRRPLKPTERFEAIRKMHEVEGLTFGEIARVFGISRQAIHGMYKTYVERLGRDYAERLEREWDSRITASFPLSQKFSNVVKAFAALHPKVSELGIAQAFSSGKKQLRVADVKLIIGKDRKMLEKSFRERVKAAKKKPLKGPKTTTPFFEIVRMLVEDFGESYSEIARMFGTSASSVYWLYRTYTERQGRTVKKRKGIWKEKPVLKPAKMKPAKPKRQSLIEKYKLIRQLAMTMTAEQIAKELGTSVHGVRTILGMGFAERVRAVKPVEVKPPASAMPVKVKPSASAKPAPRIVERPKTPKPALPGQEFLKRLPEQLRARKIPKSLIEIMSFADSAAKTAISHPQLENIAAEFWRIEREAVNDTLRMGFPDPARIRRFELLKERFYDEWNLFRKKH